MAFIRDPWKYLTRVCCLFSKPSNSKSGSALQASYLLEKEAPPTKPNYGNSHGKLEALETKKYLWRKTTSTSTSSRSSCRKSLRKWDTDSYVIWPHTTICLEASLMVNEQRTISTYSLLLRLWLRVQKVKSHMHNLSLVLNVWHWFFYIERWNKSASVLSATSKMAGRKRDHANTEHLVGSCQVGWKQSLIVIQNLLPLFAQFPYHYFSLYV